MERSRFGTSSRRRSNHFSNWRCPRLAFALSRSRRMRASSSWETPLAFLCFGSAQVPSSSTKSKRIQTQSILVRPKTSSPCRRWLHTPTSISSDASFHKITSTLPPVAAIAPARFGSTIQRLKSFSTSRLCQATAVGCGIVISLQMECTASLCLLI